MLTKARLNLDYRWIIVLVPGLFGLIQLVSATIFASNADVFLASIFFVCALLLIGSSCLYILELRMVAYLSIFVAFLLYLFLFFYYTGSFFEFTGSDSLMYYNQSQKRLNLPLSEALASFVKNTKYGWDDTGMIIYSHMVFSCLNSVVFQRIVNFSLLITQATMMRAILKNFAIDNRIIYLTLGLYVSNSAILYFVSSGLKETLFNTIIVFIWYCYFIKGQRIIGFFYMLVSVSSLYLFRIPELLLTFISVMSRQSKRYLILLLIPLLGLVFVVFYKFKDVILWYFNRGEQDVAVAHSNGLVYKFSVYCSALFGPFATFMSSEDHRDTLLYSMGLTTLMTMRLYLLLSVKYILRKSKVIIPLLVHIGLHIVVLTVVDRTLKIRYWMPALPAIFLCFAYVVNLSEHRGSVSLRMLLASFFAAVWLTLWNILRYS